MSRGSYLAERITDTSLGAYSASKAALVGLTKALARDLGQRGITANVVHPGSTDTDMNPADGPHAEHLRQKMATPRFGKAEEIPGMVAWLAGPEGRFVTGTALTIDGGANACIPLSGAAPWPRRPSRACETVLQQPRRNL